MLWHCGIVAVYQIVGIVFITRSLQVFFVAQLAAFRGCHQCFANVDSLLLHASRTELSICVHAILAQLALDGKCHPAACLQHVDLYLRSWRHCGCSLILPPGLIYNNQITKAVLFTSSAGLRGSLDQFFRVVHCTAPLCVPGLFRTCRYR
jgi:hypothetical protein